MPNIRNGASSQIDMSIQQHYTNTLHFRAYKRLVEGVRTSESTSSTWECRALSSSGIPEAARHEDTTTPGSGATPNRSLEIADPYWWGSGRAVLPAALSGPGTKDGSASSGQWLSPKPPLSWSCITPVAIYWLEETHTAWLLASAMSPRPL